MLGIRLFDLYIHSYRVFLYSFHPTSTSVWMIVVVMFGYASEISPFNIPKIVGLGQERLLYQLLSISFDRTTNQNYQKFLIIVVDASQCAIGWPCLMARKGQLGHWMANA